MLKYSSVKQLSERNGENEFSRAKKCEIITGYKTSQEGTVLPAKLQL